MREQVLVVIRVPIQELAQDLKLRHRLTHDLFDVKLDGDSLILSFKQSAPTASESTSRIPTSQKGVTKGEPLSVTTHSVLSTKSPGTGEGEKVTRRRKTLKRNRMKTRGWQVVAKIENSKGQTGVVYRPFVDKLFGKNLTPAQQRAAVAEVLRSNGNDPTEASIDYFLMNTLEYLAKASPRKPEAHT